MEPTLKVLRGFQGQTTNLTQEWDLVVRQAKGHRVLHQAYRRRPQANQGNGKALASIWSVMCVFPVIEGPCTGRYREGASAVSSSAKASRTWP